MRKTLKKFLAVCCAAILSLGCAACGGNGGPGSGANDPQTLDVYYWSTGNGSEYMQQILNAFKAKNPDVSINFRPSSAVEFSDIYLDPDNVTTDIYFTTTPIYSAYRNYLEPLNGVLDMSVDGVTVKDKFAADMIMSLTQDDGNIYSLPWSNSVTGFVYNATVFEQEGYSLPKTTDELATLCSLIQSDGHTPFIHYPDYWNYIIFSWMAQYAGVDNFNKYWKGIYTDEEGNEKTNDISLFKDNVATGKALEVLHDLLAPKGNVYTGTNNLPHTSHS